MPRKNQQAGDGFKRNEAPSKQAQNNGYHFINVSLSKKDTEGVTRWADDIPRCMDSLFGLVDKGFKTSFSYDAKNHSYTASLTDNDPNSPTHKQILTAKGKSLELAIGALCYKHYDVLQGSWLSDEEQGYDFG